MLSPAILADRRADPQNWPCNSTGFPEWRAGDCTCKVCTPIKTPSGAPPDIESPKYTEAKRLDDVEAGNQRLHQPFQPFHTQNGQYLDN